MAHSTGHLGRESETERALERWSLSISLEMSHYADTHPLDLVYSITQSRGVVVVLGETPNPVSQSVNQIERERENEIQQHLTRVWTINACIVEWTTFSRDGEFSSFSRTQLSHC